MLLIPNALCCSLYKCNCSSAVTRVLLAKKKKKKKPLNCQLLQVKKNSNVQVQLHFGDDQQRAFGFGISNISYSLKA